MAVPKEKFGIIAKPSTRMMMTLAAMTISPKLFVRDCTITMAMEKMAWVMPEGSPSRMISNVYFFYIFRWRNLKSKISVIRSSFQKQRIADTACAMTVA